MKIEKALCALFVATIAAGNVGADEVLERDHAPERARCRDVATGDEVLQHALLPLRSE